MHPDELAVDAALVARLVAAQFPAWAALPVRRVRSTGTVNAIFRLGEELYARLPLLPHWAADLEREQRWLPRLAPRLPLRVPEPVARGEPDAAYPLPWSVFRWIPGAPYDDDVADEPAAAAALAAFVTALRAIPVDGAPPAGRRPLAELDEMTRSAIDRAGGAIDAAAATAAWERALAAPVWDGARTWIHGDLLRPNLLVRDGRLHAVIDFGGAGAGDPATDVLAAWAVFGPAGRAAFRAALAVDDGAWERARGIALHQAVMIVPYYAETNPAFVTLARRTIDQILAT
jgi:aminoglycoside phosphotransferase (APT) family kinase protein